MNWTVIAFAILSACAPVALILARQWVASHVKSQRLRQWADGALSAAGRAYVLLVQLRQANPGAPLDQLVQQAVGRTAQDLMTDYRETAAAIGADTADAASRVKGNLGALLAADPTVSVAASQPAPRVALRDTTTPLGATP